MLKDEGKLGDRFVAFHPVELKDHEQRKKQKLVDVKARYCHCLITTLAWSSWEESQKRGYKRCAEPGKAGVLQTSSAF